MSLRPLIPRATTTDLDPKSRPGSADEEQQQEKQPVIENPPSFYDADVQKFQNKFIKAQTLRQREKALQKLRGISLNIGTKNSNLLQTS